MFHRYWVSLFASGLLGTAVLAADPPQGVDLWQEGDPGERLIIDGLVLDGGGKPVEGAEIYIRQADGNGEYHEDRYRTVLISGKGGRYVFATVLPGQYYGVKHIHVFVTHDDYQSLETRILFKGDPNLDPATDRDSAIFLEKAQGKGEPVLVGRFDIVLTPK